MAWGRLHLQLGAGVARMQVQVSWSSAFIEAIVRSNIQLALCRHRWFHAPFVVHITFGLQAMVQVVYIPEQ